MTRWSLARRRGARLRVVRCVRSWRWFRRV